MKYKIIYLNLILFFNFTHSVYTDIIFIKAGNINFLVADNMLIEITSPVDVIDLKYIDAAQTAQVLHAVVPEFNKPITKDGYFIVGIKNDRLGTNKLFMRLPDNAAKSIKALIDRLDAPLEEYRLIIIP